MYQDFLIINISGRNESILELLHGSSHQGKVAAEANTFGLMWSNMPNYIETCLD